MEWTILISLIIALGLLYGYFSQDRNKLQIGQPAPDFQLPDQHGNTHSLSDFRGKWLALYFYPKDDTPGCTRQACAFRDGLQEITDLGATVIGISVDDTGSHARFSRKYLLQFPLLADTAAETAARYHSLFRIGPLKFARRNTFLITPQGTVARTYLSASAARNASEVVRDLIQLEAGKKA
ncbi:MAG: peroxiredoxin [Nitrosomonas sp.]|nr:MAG: peroxiredoxin [Nitrosomonas sp.]